VILFLFSILYLSLSMMFISMYIENYI
jgi:hypothetical protein